MRARFKLHENDVGSAQVLIAVPTARLPAIRLEPSTNPFRCKPRCSPRAPTVSVSRLLHGYMSPFQVQIAVLTARIQYMTKHMQENKKDYASLRGLTRMVAFR